MDRPTALPSPRTRAAWRAWLEALAVDAEAAIAAALTYESLDAEARALYLDAVDEEADAVAVPRVALYAPLLGVETDKARRARIEAAIGEELFVPREKKRAFGASLPNGERLTVLLLPLYLGFVELLACRHSDEGVVSVVHEPLRAARDLTITPEWQGIALAEAELADAIEELAHAVVATQRHDRTPPEALARFADLFSLSAASA